MHRRRLEDDPIVLGTLLATRELVVTLLKQTRSGWATKLLVATVVVSIVTVGLVSLTSRMVSNAGLLALARSLVRDGVANSADPHAPDLINAGSWLEAATRLDATNRGAWRGLGFALEALGRSDEAITAWRTAGGMGEDFVQRGETARGAGQYEEALKWYEKAKNLAPEKRDSRVLSGIVFAVQSNFEPALSAFQDALAFSSRTDRFGDSDIYYQIGLLYQLRFQPANLVGALAAYNNAIRQADFQHEGWEADAYYRRGEVTLWLGRSQESALADFEKAVGLNPDHAFARIHLAGTCYDVYKDFPRAQAELLHVIDADPKNEWAYLYLGRIYEAENMMAEAMRAYRQVLLIDATDTVARQRLDALEKR